MSGPVVHTSGFLLRTFLPPGGLGLAASLPILSLASPDGPGGEATITVSSRGKELSVNWLRTSGESGDGVGGKRVGELLCGVGNYA